MAEDTEKVALTPVPDRVWCSLERKVSLGVDTYESVTVTVGSSANVPVGIDRTDQLMELEGELIGNLKAILDVVNTELGL